MSVAHIVVPEGLNRPGAGGELSRAYEACLRQAAAVAAAGEVVYMAPGNAFGHARLEDEIGAAFLAALRPDVVIRTVDAPRDRYLDTLDNAVVLRRWAEQRGEWPLGDCLLYCTRFHAWRSRICFRAAGFAVRRVVTSCPRGPKGLLPLRLAYYDFPPAHIAYEAAAIGYAGLRWWRQ